VLQLIGRRKFGLDDMVSILHVMYLMEDELHLQRFQIVSENSVHYQMLLQIVKTMLKVNVLF
jgi:hypothetical protein